MMKFRTISLTLFFIIFLVEQLSAQHQVRTSQFFMNAPAINPAFTGIDDFWEVKTGYRKQFSGLESAPSSYFLGVYGVLKKPDPLSFQENSLRISDPGIYQQEERKKGLRHGVGLILSLDQQPGIDHQLAMLNYALHLSVSSKLNLTMGTSVGIFIRDINVNELTVKQLADQTYQDLIDMGARQTYLDVNLGILLYGEKFYFGGSAIPLVQNAFSSSDAIEDDNAEIGYNIMTGYQFNLTPEWRLQTNAIMRYDTFNELNYEIGLKLRKYDIFWGGLSYNSNESIILLFGAMIKDRVTLGYSYDYFFGDLGDVGQGSHEIILGLSLFKNRKSSPYTW